MQNILIGFIVVFLLIVIATFAVAVVYLFQEMRKSQSKVENTIKIYEGQLRDIRIRQQYEIEKARHDSVETSRRTIKGQIAEQFAPFLQGFPYLPSDSHFIGAPIDYIIFNGYTEFKDNHGSNDNFEVVIIDIKYNTAQLTAGQEQIAKAIKAGKVRFETVRVLPDGKIEVHSWDSSTNNKSITPVESNSTEVSSAITETDSPQNNAFTNWYRFLQKFPNAYEPWSESDDNLLKEKYLAGMKVNELALLLKRNHGKIRSRLKEKGLLKKK
jgi:predicted Holliday junction resolvase-like endonuclease